MKPLQLFWDLAKIHQINKGIIILGFVEIECTMFLLLLLGIWYKNMHNIRELWKLIHTTKWSTLKAQVVYQRLWQPHPASIKPVKSKNKSIHRILIFGPISPTKCVAEWGWKPYYTHKFGPTPIGSHIQFILRNQTKYHYFFPTIHIMKAAAAWKPNTNISSRKLHWSLKYNHPQASSIFCNQKRRKKRPSAFLARKGWWRELHSTTNCL